MSMKELVIKATHIIKPAEKTWTGTMALTGFDLAFVDRNCFLPLLYLYRPNKEWDGATIVDTLRVSLAKALIHFYPFAGRLKLTEGGKAVLECEEDTMWVPLVEAEEAVEVARLVDHLVEVTAVETNEFQHLLSKVDQTKPLHELPLLLVQLTHFRCGGVTLGIRASHAVADGLALGHFFSEWTRLARGEPLGMAPVLDRDFLRGGEPSRLVPSPPPPTPPVIPPPITNSTDGAPSFKEFLRLRLAVSKSQIDKLKQTAALGSNGRPYSRFEVLTAHAWRVLSKTRKHEGDKLNMLGIVVDIRKRMNPPLPQAYFGNAIIRVPATIESSDDIYSNPLGYWCGRIRQAIDQATNEYVSRYLDHLKSKDDPGAWRGYILTPEGQFVKPDYVMVAWLRLSIMDLDFGWGMEAYMADIPSPFGGVGCFMPAREEGSAIVAICVEIAQVDNFKKYFYQDLI